MEKLRELLELYSRWEPLKEYIRKIDSYRFVDFSLALENSKALLESIAKEICKEKDVEVENNITINSLLKKAFIAIGYKNNTHVTKISSALATIGQQLGNLRNTIGTTSHGRTLDEIEERNNKVDELAKKFLIEATELIASFLIECFENENPRMSSKDRVSYENNQDFNDYWDNEFGEFMMGEYSYAASEILYNVDPEAYLYELNLFLSERASND